MAESEAQLRQRARRRGDGRCEYCRVRQATDVVRFHIEHVVPRKHGGEDVDGNLALACRHCNGHKGADLTGIDPRSGHIERLFNPRTDGWDEHFRVGPDGIVDGKTPVGRTTVVVLDMNDKVRRAVRARYEPETPKS